MTLEIIIAFLLVCCVLFAWVPLLPWIPMMFVLTVVYGFATGFTVLTPTHLAYFGAAAAFSLAVDWSSGLLGAKLGGASRTSVLWGLAGMVLGFFAAPPVGMVVGLFLGVLISELVQKRPGSNPLKSATASLVASGVGMIINATIAVAYVVAFFLIVF